MVSKERDDVYGRFRRLELPFLFLSYLEESLTLSTGRKVMSKVKLNEVFLVHRQPINIGRKVVFESDWQQEGPEHVGHGQQQLKPELEKVLMKHAKLLADTMNELPDGSGDMLRVIATQLRDFAHELEDAEGEDPKELDKGGPPAGSTGKK